MPRAIPAKASLAKLEAEVVFTRVRIEADPIAVVLLPETDGWLGDLDALALVLRSHRIRRASVYAKRRAADDGLDDAVEDVLDHVAYDARKDDKPARLSALLGKLTRSAFLRQRLRDENDKVQGWLRESHEPVLDAHRERLEGATKAVADALSADADMPLAQSEVEKQRSAFAQKLTQERDALHDELSRLARLHKLARNWPDRFFLTSQSARREDGEPTPPGEDSLD